MASRKSLIDSLFIGRFFVRCDGAEPTLLFDILYLYLFPLLSNLISNNYVLKHSYQVKNFWLDKHLDCATREFIAEAMPRSEP